MNTQTGILVHPEDVYQTGPDDTFKRVTVIDCDGESVGWLMRGYSEEQLRDIVRFANGFFAAGLRIGRTEAQERMRAALGLDAQAQQKGPAS